MALRPAFCTLFLPTLLACTSAQPVTLNFRGMVGDKDFACGQHYPGVGKTATQFTPADFRFYVSRVRLVASDGREVPLVLDEDHVWQHAGVALLDFEDKSGPCAGGTTGVNQVIRGKAPAGTYTGLRFDLGLPANLNHEDASVADPPLNVTGMFWSWQTGYRFLRAEGATTGIPVGYNAHVGSVGCTRQNKQTQCSQENLAQVSLDGFDPRSGVVIADLARLLSDMDMDHNTHNTAPGCMSEIDDPDCAPMLHSLGLPFGQETAAPAPQKFFRFK